MTIAALITSGIGVGSSALFLMTGGLGSATVTPPVVVTGVRDPGAGSGRRLKPWPFPIVGISPEFLAALAQAEQELREEIAEDIREPEKPPTVARAKRIAMGLLSQLPAAPRSLPAPDIRRAERALRDIRRDLLAYAADMAEQRLAEEEDEDIISVLLQ